MKKEQQQKTIEHVMVLKVKEHDNSSKFYEKSSARLFNDEEMEKLNDLISAYVNCGYEIKVERERMEMLKWKHTN